MDDRELTLPAHTVYAESFPQMCIQLCSSLEEREKNTQMVY